MLNFLKTFFWSLWYPQESKVPVVKLPLKQYGHYYIGEYYWYWERKHQRNVPDGLTLAVTENVLTGVRADGHFFVAKISENKYWLLNVYSPKADRLEYKQIPKELHPEMVVKIVDLICNEATSK